MDNFYSMKECAEKLHLSLGTTQRYVNAGIIPAIHVGRRVLVPEAYFEKLAADAMEAMRKFNGETEEQEEPECSD
jgi:excisionase family DNA binding protein